MQESKSVETVCSKQKVQPNQPKSTLAEKHWHPLNIYTLEKFVFIFIQYIFQRFEYNTASLQRGEPNRGKIWNLLFLKILLKYRKKIWLALTYQCLGHIFYSFELYSSSFPSCLKTALNNTCQETAVPKYSRADF